MSSAYDNQRVVVTAFFSEVNLATLVFYDFLFEAQIFFFPDGFFIYSSALEREVNLHPTAAI